MKLSLTIIFFFFSFLCQAMDLGESYKLYKDDPDLKLAIKQLAESSSDIWKRSHGDYKAFLKEDYDDDAPCIHCPSHFKLAGDINKIIEKMPMNKNDAKDDVELVPIKLNKLKFLYYVSKSNLIKQARPCQIHMLPIGGSSLQDMKGDFHLAYEDILPYSNVVELQLYTPESDSVVYYYRGEGAQSNIFIEATLRPHGKATFRYFYYNPPVANKETSKISSVVDDKHLTGDEDFLKTDAFRFEHRGIVPKNFHLFEAETKKTFYEDYTLHAENDLSVKGNNLYLSLKNSTTKKDIMTAEVRVKTFQGGNQEYKMNVPYEIGYYQGSKITSNTSVDNNGEAINLTVTDYNADWLRTEVRRDSATGHGTFYLEKITNLAPKETLVTRYGLDNQGQQYLSLQHKKDLYKNTSMVLDVRHDFGGETTLVYQFQKKF